MDPIKYLAVANAVTTLQRASRLPGSS